MFTDTDQESTMTTYVVYMINFDVYRGTFLTLTEAQDHARTLGFECGIYRNEPGLPSVLMSMIKTH